MRYRMVASPAFAARWFETGVDAASLAHAPVVVFDTKDDLQHRYARDRFGLTLEQRPHFVPSSTDFVAAVEQGFGWATAPDLPVVQGDACRLMLRDAWFPGVVGDIAALHARQYAASHGFGAVFEAKVARELGEFLTRPPRPGDVFRAVEREGRALGSIALEDEGAGIAHLRWFILDEALRGSGLGRRMLGAVMEHARAAAFTRVYLWTL
eukprot:gene11269-13783_t